MTKVHFYNREGLYMGHSEIPDNTTPDAIQCGMFVFKRLEYTICCYQQVLSYSVFEIISMNTLDQVTQGEVE